MYAIAWNTLRKHWPIALLATALLGALFLGYRLGRNAGYRQGVASVPPCPAVKEVNHAEVTCPKVEERAPKVLVKYVRDPALPPICPPTPVVFLGGGSTSVSGGTAAAGSAAEIRPVDAPRVGGGPTTDLGDARVWRIGALVGAGGSGLEVGGELERRLGPIDVGLYGRAPIHDVGHASGGVTLGIRF